jgi:hypothetical protein
MGVRVDPELSQPGADEIHRIPLGMQIGQSPIAANLPRYRGEPSG